MAGDEGAVGLRDAKGYADHVLRAALTAPGAAASPAAARTVAGLVGLLAAEGAELTVGYFLGAEPGEPSSFDVSAYRDIGEGQWRLDRAIAGLDVGRALREASRLAQSGADRVTVVAVGRRGLRRRVLERAGGDTFAFLFPADGAFEGDPERCEQAASLWAKVFSPDEVEAAFDANGAPGDGHDGAAAHEPSRRTGKRRTVAVERPAPASDSAVATAAPPVIDLTDAVRDALAHVTVEVDTSTLEAVVARAVDAGVSSADFTAAVPAPQPTDVGEIARRVATELTPVLARVVSTAGAGDVPGGWVAMATLMAASDQLHIQLEAFNDRIRSGSKSLEALADELASRDRTAAALTDQLARSIQSSLDRMERRVEERLDRFERSGPYERSS